MLYLAIGIVGATVMPHNLYLQSWLVSRGTPLGGRVAIDDAESHLFGLYLLNDWSARDVQAWEYQPLGPFLAKSFATTVSPWVVTLDALVELRSFEFLEPGPKGGQLLRSKSRDGSAADHTMSSVAPQISRLS